MATGPEEKMKIWRGIVNAEKHARYYAHKADEMGKRAKLLSTLILVFSSGSVLALLVEFHNYVSAFLYALVALLTIYDMVYSPTKEATATLSMKNQCRQLVNEWEGIFLRRDEYSIMNEVVHLEHRLELITGEDSKYDPDLSSKYSKEAQNVTERRLAPEG